MQTSYCARLTYLFRRRRQSRSVCLIAEAMAAGVAVVATQTDGAREIVEDQTTGLLVPIGNIEQMAESMLSLLGMNGDGRIWGRKQSPMLVSALV